MVRGLMIFTANVPRLRMNGRRQRSVGKIGGRNELRYDKYNNDLVRNQDKMIVRVNDGVFSFSPSLLFSSLFSRYWKNLRYN